MPTSRRWCSFWAPLVEEFIAECERVERRTGRPVARSFRIHWDGDFYSLPYAQAWPETVLHYPDEFWAYTRSFRPELNVVPLLRDVPGLTLYLSVDAANYRDAERVLDQFPETLSRSWHPPWRPGRCSTGR